MRDRADQQSVRSLFPVVAPLQHAFGIDQDISEVLHVAHFVRAASDFQQWIVCSRFEISQVEQQDRTARQLSF